MAHCQGWGADDVVVEQVCALQMQQDDPRRGVATRKCTTVMLRNIPNEYTQNMLVQQLRKSFRGRFDFVYLPVDSKKRCHVGYGFINFSTGDACAEFISNYNGVEVRKCLPGDTSTRTGLR